MFITLRLQIVVLMFFAAGSGRVTFNNIRSYMKAVQAAFIEIRTPKFTKKVCNRTETKYGVNMIIVKRFPTLHLNPKKCTGPPL